MRCEGHGENWAVSKWQTVLRRCRRISQCEQQTGSHPRSSGTSSPLVPDFAPTPNVFEETNIFAVLVRWAQS